MPCKCEARFAARDLACFHQSKSPAFPGVNIGESYCFESTVGLVVERKRFKGELDGFRWYCDECHQKLYEEFLPLTDIVKRLPPIFEGFWENDNARSCKSCSAYLEKP